MIISHRRISETVEFSKPVDIVPNFLIIGMKNMGPILMHLNSFYIFGINISSDMSPFIYDKNFLSHVSRLTGKYSTEKAASYHQIIVFQRLISL